MLSEDQGFVKLSRNAVAAIAVILFGLYAYKATIASFTYDESSTYIYGVRSSFNSILRFTYASSNNHILNTILMKVCTIPFGQSELMLRLPNLAALLIYIYYSFLLIKHLEDKLLFPFFIIMISNPFVLDFFALARGYGLALAFTMMSTYFTIKYFDKYKISSLWRSLIFSSLAVLSNLSFLYFYIGLLVIIFFEYLIRKDQPFKVPLKPVTIVSAILTLLIYYPIMKLIEINQLYHGGEIGFWHDTVFSLIVNSFYGINYKFISYNILKYAIIIFFILSSLTIVYLRLIKSVKFDQSVMYLTFSNVLLLLIFIGTTLINQLFNIKFLIGRTGIFLIPVFLLSLIGVLSIIFKKNRIAGFTIACTLSAMLAYHTIISFEKDSYFLWKYDMNTKKMLIDLETDVHESNDVQEITLSVSWLYSSTVAFYRDVKDLSFIKEVKRKDDVETTEFVKSNYFYLTKVDLKLLDDLKYEVLNKYDETETYLIKIKNKQSSFTHASTNRLICSR